MTKKPVGPFIVTGASGQLAKRVIELMLEAKAGPLIAASRTPEKLSGFTSRGVDVRQADFNDAKGLAKAFSGGKRLLIVSTDALERGKRFAANKRAINAAVESGIQHIVYTSFVVHDLKSSIPFAADHGETEALLASSGVSHTILRNNMYTDVILGSAPQAIASGKLFAAAGQGSASYVTREDCARAAAAALMDEGETRTLEITGPGLVSHSALAQNSLRDLGTPNPIHRNLSRRPGRGNGQEWLARGDGSDLCDLRRGVGQGTLRGNVQSG